MNHKDYQGIPAPELKLLADLLAILIDCGFTSQFIESELKDVRAEIARRKILKPLP